MACVYNQIDQDELIDEAIGRVTGLDGDVTMLHPADAVDLIPVALEQLGTQMASDATQRNLFKSEYLSFKVVQGVSDLGKLIDDNRLLVHALPYATIKDKSCSPYLWQYVANQDGLRLHSFIERHFIWWTMDGCQLVTRNTWGEAEQRLTIEAELSASTAPTLEQVPMSLKGTLTLLLANGIQSRLSNRLDMLKGQSTIEQEAVDEAKIRNVDASCDTC